MDLDALRALLTPPGRALLASACERYATGAAARDDGLALASTLRRSHPPDLVAAALTQARLRARARTKLGEDAEVMLFTPAGLEQATRAGVAAHRARRVAAAAGAGARVADLCCGIGGDLVALARAGLRVTGVDRDPVTALVARANLEALGLDGEVLQADVTEVDRAPYAACVADPARRTARGRVFDPDAYSPPWTWVEEVLTGDACVKVAPGLPHERVPAGVEAEWVSDGGDVVEAALWSGRPAAAGPGGVVVRRRATLLPSGATLSDADDPGAAPVRGPGRWLYEPDGAVIRAGLVTAVAALVDGALLDPHLAYVTSDRYDPTPFATAYAVREVVPFREKELRALVRERGIGTLTVKKRGVDVDPAALRRRLRPAGPLEATLVVTRLAPTGRAAGTGARGPAVALLVDPVRSTPD